MDAHEVGDPVGTDGDRRGWGVCGNEESTPHVLVVLGPQTAEALDERAQALADDPDGAVGFAQRGEALAGASSTSASAAPCPRCGCPATRRCWQTSLEDQLELLTARWMNQDRRPEVLAVSGHDVLVGQGPVRRRAFRGSGAAPNR